MEVGPTGGAVAGEGLERLDATLERSGGEAERSQFARHTGAGGFVRSGAEGDHLAVAGAGLRPFSDSVGLYPLGAGQEVRIGGER